MSRGGPALPGGAAFAERLYVPFGWWALAFAFAASMFVAVGFYLGLAPAVISFVLIMAVVGAVFLGYGRAELLITDDALWAGRAHLDWEFVGAVRPLDAEQARLRRGRNADVLAWLMLRPYLPRAVEIAVDDPDDPAPYWLISTRHPRRLAEAINGRTGTERLGIGAARLDAPHGAADDTVGR